MMNRDAAIAKIHSALTAEWRDTDAGWLDEIVFREETPDWFKAGGNLLLSPSGSAVPEIVFHPNIDPPNGALIAFGRNTFLGRVMIWGNCPQIIAGVDLNLRGCVLNCGDQSQILMEGIGSISDDCTLNSRNGGKIIVGSHALWSDKIRIYTDDMHAIRDSKTRIRLNAFGSTIRIQRKVWLGFETMVMPGAEIGFGSIIGARSVVTGKIPDHCVAAGAPARVIRENATWDFQDLP